MAKDRNKELIYAVIRDIAESIAGPLSHGYAKHHKRGNEFAGGRLGPPVPIDEDPEDVIQHAYNVLTSPQSRHINTRGKRFYVYHPPSNTLCIVNPGEGDRDGGTMYRMNPETDGSGPEWHTHVTQRDAEQLGVAGFKDKPGGLDAALLRDPGLARDLRRSYEDIHAQHQQRLRDEKCRNDKPPSRPQRGKHRH